MNSTDKIIIELSSCVEEANNYIESLGFKTIDEKINYLISNFHVSLVGKTDKANTTNEESKKMDYYAMLNTIIRAKGV